MKDYDNYYPSYNDIVNSTGENIYQLQYAQEGSTFNIIRNSIIYPDKKAIMQKYNFILDEYKEIRRFIIHNSEMILNRGDYVEEPSSNDVYIVITEIDKLPIYNQAKIQRCNHRFRWQFGKELYDIPVILGDKTSVYSDGLTFVQQELMPSDNVMVLAPKDDVTDTLHLNKRVIIDNSRDNVYYISRINDVDFNGMLIIKLKRDKYNEETDDYINGLANIKTPIKEDSNIDFEVRLLGMREMYLNDLNEFTIDIRDNGNKDIFNDSTVAYNIIDTSNTIGHHELKDGKILLFVKNNRENIGKNITLELEVEYNGNKITMSENIIIRKAF